MDSSMESSLAQSILDELVDHLALGFCHSTHRAAKLGLLEMEEVAAEEESKYKIVDQKGMDVFGESSTLQGKKVYECTCPQCERTLAASRYAPHLEKCMGLGRKSSRIANTRITSSGRTNGNNKEASASLGNNNGASPSMTSLDSDPEDNDKSSDNDWNERPLTKKPRKKKKIEHHTHHIAASSSNGIVVKRLPTTAAGRKHFPPSNNEFLTRSSCSLRSSSPSISTSNTPNCSQTVGSPHHVMYSNNNDGSNLSTTSVRTTRTMAAAASNDQLSSGSSILNTIVKLETQREFQF